MDEVTHTLRGGRPVDQYSLSFLQGMVNRMLVSFHKYGPVHLAVRNGVDCLASCKQRLAKYEETGNTEYLMDAANYAMMEYMYPSHPQAHFDAESRSPGRTLRSGRVTAKHSEDL